MAALNNSTESTPGKDPTLLPTPSLSPDEFEDFTERLLSAHRACVGDLRHVSRVDRWGRKGDKQDGIDFEGEWSDGSSSAWQCKRYDNLTAAQVKKFVGECTFEADEYYLVYSGEASRNARLEMAKHENWELIDRRGLGRLLDDLPLHRKRQVLDDTWGTAMRKQLLKVPGEDAFLTISAFRSTRLDPLSLLNDCGPLIGRTTELSALSDALDPANESTLVTLVTGPGGRGKSRLLAEALSTFSEAKPQIPVLCLSLGRQIDQQALQELPHTPSILVIDDAHRDPSALGPLFQYLRSTPGTKLILGSRNTGRDLIRAEIARFGIRTQQVEQIDVGELSAAETRRLVISLADGLGLSYSAITHFTKEARDSPLIAVLALNMIRRGELDGPLAFAPGLRQEVMNKYQTVLAGNIDGFQSETVRRFLAVYAAIGPVDANSQQSVELISSFCGLRNQEFLRLRNALHERGVLVSRSDKTRIVPDILADQILERESAIGGDATGFADELWEHFSASHGIRLVETLAELDWRLRSQNGPSIIAPIWRDIRDELNHASPAGLRNAIKDLVPLSYTQPHALFAFLDQIHALLAGSLVPAASENASKQFGFVRDDSAWLEAFGSAQPSAETVAYELAKPYASCAVNAPDLLEPVMDALWRLSRVDPRLPNQHNDHPENVVGEVIVNFGELADASFPERIVGCVDKWLSQDSHPEDRTTPLFALRPLFRKDGQRYVLESPRNIAIRPYFIDALAHRPARAQARDLLIRESLGRDLRRIGISIEILGSSLSDPRGSFGRLPSEETLQGWEPEKLVTLAGLAKISAETRSAVVRRCIRHEVEWTASYSKSIEAKWAAWNLISNIDEILEDDLAESLLNRYTMFFSLRGKLMQTFEEFSDSQDSKNAKELLPFEDEMEEGLAKIARRDFEIDSRRAQVTRSLFENSTVSTALDTIEECCVEILNVNPRDGYVSGLQPLASEIVSVYPTLVPEMVSNILGRVDGPLDEIMPIVLNAWAALDEKSLHSWLENLSTYRTRIRAEVAKAFEQYGWTDLGISFEEIHSIGCKDDDPDVAARFVAGSHRLLRRNPVDTARRLLEAGATKIVLAELMNRASEYDGIGWGLSLGDSEAVAVLSLIEKSNINAYAVQSIMTGIADRHPRLVLDALLRTFTTPDHITSTFDGLAAVYDREAVMLVAWLLEKIDDFDQDELEVAGLARVVALVVHDGITHDQQHEIEVALDTMPGTKISGVLDCLNELPIWPLRRPTLVASFIAQAKATGDIESVQDKISSAMRISSFGFINGESDELEHAFQLATKAAADCEDAALRDLYVEASEQVRDTMLALARDDEEDDD
ncbi:restriction endonuclease [Paeniglutamicibacter sp.]|uniref:restriction endonuclease n=1 Tax=Paeniglutamicibacter sp. TaxID=1934391 RepID=UPI0039896A9E